MEDLIEQRTKLMAELKDVNAKLKSMKIRKAAALKRQQRVDDIIDLRKKYTKIPLSLYEAFEQLNDFVITKNDKIVNIKSISFTEHAGYIREQVDAMLGIEADKMTGRYSLSLEQFNRKIGIIGKYLISMGKQDGERQFVIRVNYDIAFAYQDDLLSGILNYYQRPSIIYYYHNNGGNYHTVGFDNFQVWNKK